MQDGAGAGVTFGRLSGAGAVTSGLLPPTMILYVTYDVVRQATVSPQGPPSRPRVPHRSLIRCQCTRRRRRRRRRRYVTVGPREPGGTEEEQASALLRVTGRGRRIPAGRRRCRRSDVVPRVRCRASGDTTSYVGRATSWAMSHVRCRTCDVQCLARTISRCGSYLAEMYDALGQRMMSHI